MIWWRTFLHIFNGDWTATKISHVCQGFTCCNSEHQCRMHAWMLVVHVIFRQRQQPAQPLLSSWTKMCPTARIVTLQFSFHRLFQQARTAYLSPGGAYRDSLVEFDDNTMGVNELRALPLDDPCLYKKQNGFELSKYPIS